MHSRHGNPVLITNNEPDAHLKELSKAIFEIPHTVDCLQTILAVVPLQLLSFHVARMKGLDVSGKTSLYDKNEEKRHQSLTLLSFPLG